MSDAFQHAERVHQVSLQYLKTLAQRRYPTVISTKGDLILSDQYLAQLKRNPHVVVQVSLVSTEDRFSKLIEPKATPSSSLLRVMETLSNLGIVVTCRLQPYIEDISGSLNGYVATVARAGAKHISIEHLKVPVEKTSNPIIEGARLTYYRRGARRDGREYVLPSSVKYEAVSEAKDACRAVGVSFGCAENEYQYLSDSWACCSGVDLFPGFEHIYKYQIGYAVRKSLGKEISLDIIKNEWRPVGSIDRYLNSRSRLGKRIGVLGTVDDHIKYRWNTSGAPGSPASFVGVYETERYSEGGNRIYDWKTDI